MTPEELKKKRIAVLMGGRSAEREVSLNTGKAVANALRNKGYDPIELDVDLDIAQQLLENEIQVAFIALHGRYGEDGIVQGLLEAMEVPYTGSGVVASALGMDKVKSRMIFQQLGLSVPPYTVVPRDQAISLAPGQNSPPLPIVVKPTGEGSSVGVRIVRSMEGLQPALAEAFSFGPTVLVESYIVGKEIQVGILDDQALGAIEIRPKVEFYDYRAKYTDGLAEHLFPAPMPEDLYQQALDLSLAAHKALGCEGGTRVDLLLENDEVFYLLEVNTLPGMTALSLLPEIARGVGISFEDLCERILLGARLKA